MPVQIPAKYHVFINHRGPDVKNSLASLIYHRLTHCGLSVFLDKNEITPGDTINNAIESAIDSASVHVAIFSRHYAQSSWCLEELNLMLRSGRKIIPVFWDVEPADVRHISNDYATAFQRHRLTGRIGEEVLEKWQTDLKRIPDTSGLLFKPDEGDLGELLEAIVKAVEAVLKEEVFRSIKVHTAKYPVGLHKAAVDFENRCPHSDATTIVVIVGMVGVGKSILAKHLYKMRRPKFSRSCFLYDVKDGELLSLQKSLLADLQPNRDFLKNVHNSHRGKDALQEFLQSINIERERIFIVLDNVDGIDKIDGLLNMDAVPSGSLIFITCRDKDILRGFSASSDGVNTLVYDVEPLQEKHARELFCQHAFLQSEPPPACEGLVEQYLRICGGVPLCLEVLGNFFARNRDKEEGKLQLRTMPVDIRDTLKGISYDSLNKDLQKLFLDIGCFFVGEEKELTIRVLEGSYDDVGEYLDSLRKKCLVDYKKRKDPMIGYNNSCRSLEIITMPVPLMELARNIARTEIRERAHFHDGQGRNPLRLSSSDDIQILSEGAQAKPSFRIRGIRSSEGENPPDSSKKERDIIKAKEVRLFVAEGLVDLSSFFKSWKISGELLWLRLGNLSSFYFPHSMSLEKLRVLELAGPSASVRHFIRNWDCDAGRHELDSVDAGASNSISCPADTSSEAVRREPSIFRYWAEKGKSYYRKWKKRSVYRHLKSRVKGMASLTNLELENIKSLQSLPIDFSQLPKVTRVNLSGCVNLIVLPASFSKLSKLEYLALRDCKKLSIPLDILGKISTLVYVDFKGCAKLLELPRGIPNQKDLIYLNLLCTGLTNLPKDLELPKLEQLSIGSPALESLSLANLKGLNELHLIQCSALVSLHLQHCLGLEKLTSLSNLVNLKFLNIKECFNLQILNVEGLTSLEEIEAQACSKLHSIVGLNQQKWLNCLHISTENDIIWNEICEFLTSSSNQKPSTAIFSVKATDDEMPIRAKKRQEMQPHMKEYGNCRILNIVSTQELKDIHLYSAIVMLFITGNGQEDASTSEICVTFQPASKSVSPLEYRTAHANSEGRRLNVFMWAKESRLFKDYNGYTSLSCSLNCRCPEGRIVMIRKSSDVSKVWEEIKTKYMQNFIFCS